LRWNHEPLKPPSSEQCCVCGAFFLAHEWLASQLACTHELAVSQSTLMRHATHLPAPSHTFPPWSSQPVLASASATSHSLFLHTAIAQVVSLTGQSSATLQRVAPPPAPDAELDTALGEGLPPELAALLEPPAPGSHGASSGPLHSLKKSSRPR